MRILVKHSVALYKLTLFLKAIHNILVAVLDKTSCVVRNFFCKFALSVHRFNGRNSSAFKDFGVLFTECRSNMNDTSTVFGRNVVRIEHTECTFLTLPRSLLSAVCRIRKRRKIREKRLVPCANKFTALFLVNDSIRFFIFIIGRKTRFCQNVVVAGIVVKNFYIVNIRSHTKTFI